MSTKPETGWSKELSTLTDGDYLSRVDEYDKCPTLIRIENAAVYEMGQGGNLRREYAAEDYEYLGPFTPSDFEQLIRLRKALQAEVHRQCAHCKNGLAWTEDGRAHYGYEHQGVIGIVGCTASRELHEALAQRRTGEQS